MCTLFSRFEHVSSVVLFCSRSSALHYLPHFFFYLVGWVCCLFCCCCCCPVSLFQLSSPIFLSFSNETPIFSAKRNIYLPNTIFVSIGRDEDAISCLGNYCQWMAECVHGEMIRVNQNESGVLSYPYHVESIIIIIIILDGRMENLVSQSVDASTQYMRTIPTVHIHSNIHTHFMRTIYRKSPPKCASVIFDVSILFS